ncbi:HNH endonuclease signature motif containing protein [Micromonospora mirobrigensis]|uniref:HNH endonuclease n=1 Tax=Micromonospora mirobrigensis TaxID=262898 RepID=A0A1C4XE77_9ACTN|nr:HNH endonuclease signature motif containing protein [Micromonospora mirobrigensis]SCF06746.1 HNH endonuclease [Micromonospora mirobrigensis]
MSVLNRTTEDLWPYGVVVGKHTGYTIDKNGCWIYDGFLDACGYGNKAVVVDGRKTSTTAHRFYWTKWVGPVTPGLELDHFKRCNRACINPEHLREVTHSVNLANRGRRKRCMRGHRFTLRNTYWSRTGRMCKTCTNARNYQVRSGVDFTTALRFMEKRYQTRPLPLTPEAAQEVSEALKVTRADRERASQLQAVSVDLSARWSRVLQSVQAT